jgi:hypothetical protein
LPGLLELAVGQRLARLLLQLGDLALAILGGLELGHALTRISRMRSSVVIDSWRFSSSMRWIFGQMPVGLGVERVDVLPVFGGACVIVWRLVARISFSTRWTLARRSSSVCPWRRAARPEHGLVVDQFQRVRGGLPAQRCLLGQCIGEQLRRFGDQRGFGLLGQVSSAACSCW